MVEKRVVIVGGGSAGWMTAAYLNGALNARGENPTVGITLVESPDIPRISVGEATIPSMRHILGVIGVDEQDFMRKADATFKQSIKYANWLHKDNTFYHHPFSRFRIGPIDRSGIEWLRSDRSIPFMETVSAQPIICEMGLSPKPLQGQDRLGLSYAYHMNAQKFADYLRDFSVVRGVSHVLDNVIDVTMHENGNIASVITEGGKTLSADIFVDCTGFSARLIEQKLGVPFVDCSQFLLCDRAVTMHLPYDEFYPGMVRPYTTATALSAGWVWDIPMRNQRSIGYVHSSHFISEEEAEKEIRAYEGEHSNAVSSRLVRFKVGCRDAHWSKNCVAIGLSGGFIEPLESTGLYLCDMGAVMLAEHFPFTEGSMETMAFRYNRMMSNRFYEILDFINMHYCLTRRTDTAFWQEVQKREHITDRLQAKFDYWKLKPPTPSDFQDQYFPGLSQMPGEGTGDRRPPVDTAGLWNHESYECILFGMNFMDAEYREQYGAGLTPPRVQSIVLQRLQYARSSHPPHAIWLRDVLGMEEYRPTVKPAGWI